MADAYVVKPGEGSVWPNDRKEEDWHADKRGKILMPDNVVAGAEYYIDSWDKNSNGKDWYRLKIGNPVAGSNTGTQTPVQNTNQASKPVENVTELEEDLPF
jgi:hypothetical protein|tara:strand:- start:1254 stop:1556 length:303 start_codon:yes stop_codon:yes gene_type:complete